MPLTPINFGDVVKPVQIEKFKGSTGIQQVVSFFIDDMVFAATLHYHEKVGPFYSFGGADIDACGLPKLRYVIPTIVYSGELASYGAPLSLYFYLAPESVYEDLKTKSAILKQTNPADSISFHDVLAKCEDGEYQKFKFDTLGAAKWRTDPTLKGTATGMLEEYRRLIEPSVARTIDEAKFLELTSGSGQQSSVSPPAPQPAAAPPLQIQTQPAAAPQIAAPPQQPNQQPNQQQTQAAAPPAQTGQTVVLTAGESAALQNEAPAVEIPVETSVVVNDSVTVSQAPVADPPVEAAGDEDIDGLIGGDDPLN